MVAAYGHTVPIRRFDGIDKRSKAWRRRGELIKLFTTQVGGELTPAQALDVERLADLVVLGEQLRIRMLTGAQLGNKRLAEMTKVDNAISRLKWLLGLGPRRRQSGLGEPDPLTYAEHLKADAS